MDIAAPILCRLSASRTILVQRQADCTEFARRFVLQTPARPQKTGLDSVVTVILRASGTRTHIETGPRYREFTDG
jgi:hypothetical protein